MGIVLEVHDRAIDRDVAVKVLSAEAVADPQLRSRFLREARAAGALDHPGIVTVHDVDVEGGFIVMELVRGESLRDRLLREGKLPPSEVRRIGTALLEALDAAHAEGIVHRDVKPANVLIDEDQRVKLADFGIAAFADSSGLTSTGIVVGTPAYMAPEQLRGRSHDPRVDVYAAGATLFEAATGSKLHVDGVPVETPGVAMLAATGDPALARAIAGAVRPRPDERYATARVFAEELSRETIPPEPGLPDADSAVTPVGARTRSRRWWAWGAGLLLVAIGGDLAWREVRAPAKSSGESAPLSSAASQAARTTVAILPFENHTVDPQLDFIATGVPFMVSQEIEREPNVTTIGYYQLLDRVGDAGTSLPAWVEAARAAGASMTVRGAIDERDGRLHVSISIDDVTKGRALGSLKRDTAPATLSATVRAMAAEVLRNALGLDAGIAPGQARPLETERELQLGIAALVLQRYDAAETHLVAASGDDSARAEASYYLSLLRWWQDRDAEARTFVSLALAGDLSSAQRNFLGGLELILDGRFGDAAAHFQSQVDQHPDDRDLLYGLLEALFHSGHPAEGAAVYRRMCAASPNFRLGAFHAWRFYVSHGDEEGMAFISEQVAEANPAWPAILQIAHRDYGGAVETLQRRGESPGELVAAHALAGHVTLALSLAEAGDARRDPVNTLGLELAAGAPAVEVRAAQATAETMVLATGPLVLRSYITLDLAGMQAPDPDVARVHAIENLLRQLDTEPNVAHEVRALCTRALLAGYEGDRNGVDEARRSAMPPVAAIGDAFTAAREGDSATEAKAWARAAEGSGDGGLMIVARFLEARARRAAADRKGVVAACDDVIHPRLFTAGWGALVGACLVWTGEAHAASGEASDARAAYARLLALRSMASERDALVLAARSGLAALDSPPR
jgi:TolB-like protein